MAERIQIACRPVLMTHAAAAGARTSPEHPIYTLSFPPRNSLRGRDGTVPTAAGRGRPDDGRLDARVYFVREYARNVER